MGQKIVRSILAEGAYRVEVGADVDGEDEWVLYHLFDSYEEASAHIERVRDEREGLSYRIIEP